MRNTGCLLTGLLMLGWCLSAQARVSGPCVNCHTMHNSQGGKPMNWDESFTPNPALLLGDCIGCHTGSNTGFNSTPFVFSITGPEYKATGTEPESNTLAGGSFYWMANISDRMGHNVYGLAGPDGTLSLPPGGDGSFSDQLNCAGSMGCHGRQNESGQITSMRATHHYKNHSEWQDGSTPAASYRFLDTIQGFGDREYEFRPTDQQHNKYYGIDRTGETEPADGTISSQCARCHEYYHDGSGSLVSGTAFGSGVWIRHPTDFDMSNAASSDEYERYNGGSGSGNMYSVVSPVATTDTSNTVNATIYSTNDDAVVMCLSCHRAHGTPFNGLLRWDYKSWPAPGGYNGCAVCHTAKD
ncbi:MAG: cytochrome c3 family protein [Desulfobulbaceae bacterium]|nr:cytochrome c3 family protein [Desulfobulbaceae bacterium]